MEIEDQKTDQVAPTASLEPTEPLEGAITTSTTASTPSIDDLISAATIENHQAVLQAIAEEKSAIVQDTYIGKLAKVLGVAKPAISKQMKQAVVTPTGDEADMDEDLPLKAVFPGLVDLVKDEAGKVRYLVKDEGGLRLESTWVDDEGTIYEPPGTRYIKFPIPNAERVISQYKDTDDTKLYEDLLAFFKRFSYLEDDVWPIIVLSVLLSYMQDHPDVRYIPVIYFYAVAERGKSRTAKTMLATSYRGLHLVDIRPANVIRFAQHFNATIFFDVTDLWKSAEKGEGAQDILLGRFEKGTQVVRVLNPDKGPIADQEYFDVFGSTIVATNEPANITFESRCLSISMPNKPGRYENLTPAMGLPFRDSLTAFRARMMDKQLPYVEPIPGISGRLWDISEPLFQLAQMIAPIAFEQMKRVLLEMSGQKIEDKKDTIEGQLIAAIAKIARFDGNLPTEIPVEEIRTQLNLGKPVQYQVSPQKVGKRIQSLSIKTKAVNGRSRAVITIQELNRLKEQYGLLAPVLPEEPLPLATTDEELHETGISEGRELIESETDNTEFPTENDAAERSVSGLVESCSEFPHATTEEERHKQYLDLIGGEGAAKATEAIGTEPPKKRPLIRWAKPKQ